MTGVTTVAYAADGRLLSGGGDGTVRWWDLEAGVTSSFTDVGREVQAVGIVPTGGQVVVATRSGSLRLWDAELSAPLATFAGSERSVQRQRLAVDPVGRYLASSAADGVWIHSLQDERDAVLLPTRVKSRTSPSAATADSWWLHRGRTRRCGCGTRQASSCELRIPSIAC